MPRLLRLGEANCLSLPARGSVELACASRSFGALGPWGVGETEKRLGRARLRIQGAMGVQRGELGHGALQDSGELSGQVIHLRPVAKPKKGGGRGERGLREFGVHQAMCGGRVTLKTCLLSWTLCKSRNASGESQYTLIQRENFPKVPTTKLELGQF